PARIPIRIGVRSAAEHRAGARGGLPGRRDAAAEALLTASAAPLLGRGYEQRRRFVANGVRTYAGGMPQSGARSSRRPCVSWRTLVPSAPIDQMWGIVVFDACTNAIRRPS